jgi:predicted metal-dependent enzyme (double-stranded beta helix superfamily)
MFDVDTLIADCQSALDDAEPRLAIRDVLQRTLSEPEEVAEVLRPTEGGINLLHQSDDLTVINVVWAPHMRIFPHDHRMWAAIGIYLGREDNEFFRRPEPGARTLVESGGKTLDVGEVVILGDDTIHAVTNPISGLTGAIHVYGGDFVNQPRSQWGPGPQEERPYVFEEAQAEFAAANAAWRG